MSGLTNAECLRGGASAPAPARIALEVLKPAPMPREEAQSQALGMIQCGVCMTMQPRRSAPLRWPLYHSAAYLNGPGVHVFSNNERIFHKRGNTHEAFCLGVSHVTGGDVDIVSRDFSKVLARDSMNWVFLDLEAAARIAKQFPMSVAPPLADTVRACVRSLRADGHLVVLASSATQTPEVHDMLAKLGGWVVKDQHQPKVGGPEISVLKKLHAGRSIRKREQPAGKRACVWRSGALGDLVMITPLLERLKEDGYHVTVCTSRNSLNLLAEHPACDNVLMHEREVIFNPELGVYWKYWEERYDKYINLSESIEGDLLRLEGREEFYHPVARRSADCGSLNYFVHTLRKGGYDPRPGDQLMPSLYFTSSEHSKAQGLVAKAIVEAKVPARSPVVMWLMKGSSYHKSYPMIHAAVDMLLAEHPNAVVCLSGGPGEEKMGFAHPSGRVVNWIGKHTPRMAMLLTRYVDVVVGPETGMMNAAAAFDTPKVVMLSHSSAKNLCEFWTSTTVLTPDAKIAPCYGKDGCHQLHYSLDSCPLLEAFDPATQQVLARAPACTMAIAPDVVVNAVSAAIRA